MTATDEQKPDLEQLQQDLNELIELTQHSILQKISESPKEADQDSLTVSLFIIFLKSKKTNRNLNIGCRMICKQ